MSCDDGLDVTQEYPFTVEAMPVQDEVAYGETVELRLSIVEDGGFDGNGVHPCATSRRTARAGWRWRTAR